MLHSVRVTADLIDDVVCLIASVDRSASARVGPLVIAADGQVDCPADSESLLNLADQQSRLIDDGGVGAEEPRVAGVAEVAESLREESSAVRSGLDSLVGPVLHLSHAARTGRLERA